MVPKAVCVGLIANCTAGKVILKVFTEQGGAVMEAGVGAGLETLGNAFLNDSILV